MNLRQVGEDRLIKRLISHLRVEPRVLSGAGDDCAVVRLPKSKDLMLLKTDCVVEGVHFLSNTPATAVGWKAMMRPLSDFAAASGLPRFALVTLIVPPGKRVAWITRLYRGLERAAREFDLSIVGGETSATRGPAMISVSVAGFVEKKRWVSRRGGRPNDKLFVTGRLGGSRRGKHLRFRARIEESRWLTKHFEIHAMMDLSDGLGADLPRLAQANNLDFEIEEDRLPRNRGCSVREAISDGEDYELLFAISRRERPALEKRWQQRFPRLALSCIGRFYRKSKIGNQKLAGGYVHFQ